MRCHDRLKLVDREHHEIDAEAGVDAAELCADEAAEVGGIAGRRARAGPNAGDGAVGAIERQPEPSPAEPEGLQALAEIPGKLCQGGFDALRRDQRLGEGKTDGGLRWRDERGSRLAEEAQGLIEAEQNGCSRAAGGERAPAFSRSAFRGLTEAPLEGAAWQSVEIADAFQPEPSEQVHGGGGEAQSGDRQSGEGRSGLSDAGRAGSDRSRSETRNGMRRAERVGETGAGGDALAGEALHEIADERRLAPEQVRDACDVDPGTIRAVPVVGRAIAAEPV